MATLGDTIAELLARTRALSSADAPGGGLTQVADFGPNPGALKMWLRAPQPRPAPVPLVVVLHGCAQTAAGYAAGAGWLELADRCGFVVLCPEQTRANNANLCFNWFEDADVARGAGEAASIAQMVRHATAELDVDPRRVFVTGLSAGGAMTAAMLAAYPEVFRAGAIVAGLPYGAASGVGRAMAAMRHVPDLTAAAWGDKVRAAAPAPPRRPTVSIWHGDADATVTPAAAEALALQWCDVHGGGLQAIDAPGASPRHRRTTWRRADGEVVVELNRIAGLGHGAPIAAKGADACGAPGPWILEAGVSSTREIARAWALDASARPGTAAPADRAAAAAERAPHAPPRAATAATTATTGVAATIARALKEAGLLR